MNRHEAQQQLTAVAHAIRQGDTITPERYPVLSRGVRSGGVLWQLSAALVTTEGWSDQHTANWYEYKAIHHLNLDEI